MLNKVAEKLTGWTTNEAEGRHYKEVFVLSHENEALTKDDPIERVVITDAVQKLGNHAMLASEDENKCLLEYSTVPLQLKILPLVLF
jgi:diguanylate cyclase